MAPQRLICPGTRHPLPGEAFLPVTLEEQIIIDGRFHSNSGRTGMSIFGSIVSAIFGPSSSQTSAAPAAAETPADQSASAASPAADTPAAEIPVAQSAPAAAPAGEPVDVAAIMDNLASQAAQKLNWRNSIVDLMKLINLDSSLAARKELRGGFQNSRASLPATRNMQAVWSRDWMMKPSRS